MKKNKEDWLCRLALLIVAIIILVLFNPKPAGSNTGAIKTSSTQVVAEPAKPIEVPKSVPKVLQDIGWCESNNNQEKRGHNYRYKNVTDEEGNVTNVKYLWSTDIGKYQINDFYHAETAKKLGYDIYTEEGNTAYALLLYNKNGTSDWLASKACWSDIEAWKATHKQPFYQ